jgi:outer membrane lipoprotein carrier protein
MIGHRPFFASTHGETRMKFLKTKMLIKYILLASLLLFNGPLAKNTPAGDAATLDEVLKGIEQRYAGKGFAASFFQESLLKAMRITDTAEGELTVRHPDKMRWEYTLPEKQTIVTDGNTMWIHRPMDNQVMVGKAPEYFGGGKGAGFLSDISQIRGSFAIELQPAESADYYRLKLLPHKPNTELAEIVLSISRATYQIDQVVTFNAYGDETRIVLNNYRFHIEPDDALFKFTIPDGADVIEMDQF